MLTIDSDPTIAQLDLGIQGSSWSELFQFAPSGTPVDITGAVITCDFRYRKQDSTAAASLTCAVVTGASGIWSMSLSPTQHAALVKYQGVFDVKIVLSSGTVEKPLAGTWKTIRRVTP